MQADIAIIGAGPAGIFAVFQAGMLGMKAVVIDALPQIGGQCQALYPEKPIYDIPAYPQISAGQLIEQLKQQAAPFNPHYLLEQKVTELQRSQDGFNLQTDGGQQIFAKAVIIAAGCGAFVPNRPPLVSIEKFEGRSVHYMVQNMQIFAGKNLVIAGGGDSAIDWALNLAPLAKKIYLVHRRDKFRAAPESINKVRHLAQQGRIELVTPYQLHALNGVNNNLRAVDVVDLDGNVRTLIADHLLAFFGLSMELGEMKEWNIDMHEGHFTVEPSSMQTNIKGVFAIGDIASYTGKLKLILTGFAEAAIACKGCYAIVYPNKALHFEYSTTKGVPLG